MNKQLLVETKVGGHYHDIVSRIKCYSFLFNDSCAVFNVKKPAKISQFVLVFPFSYDFLITSGRKQHGVQGYMNLMSVFFKNRFKNYPLSLMRIGATSSRHKLKNQKIAYIGLTFESLLREDEVKEVFIKLFESFSGSFKKDSKELKKHISDKNPNRYKYIN